MADSKQDMPQYELTERAYIDDVLYESGDKITFNGKPGHHMVPLNDAARARIKKDWPNGMTYTDPIEKMAQVMPNESSRMADLERENANLKALLASKGQAKAA